MQLRGTELLKAAILTYVLLVIFFALFCPFDRNAATGEWWVYGMAGLVTLAGVKEARKPRAAKPAPRSPIERARHVWAIEREVGIEPWPIYGQEPPRSIAAQRVGAGHDERPTP